jgi:hypothetical protein
MSNTTTTYTYTYPPGVMTGRPMEMFGVALPGYGIDHGLDILAVPDQWITSGESHPHPMEIIHELWNAIDQHHNEEMNWIQEQLSILERYQDETAFYMYPMIHKDGGVLALIDLTTNFGIEEALQQFEEDWEYEHWINSDQYINSLKGSNMHKLLAWDKESETMHPQWAGTCTSDSLNSAGVILDMRGLSLKDRYDVDVEIVTHHPSDKKGYAKGTTDYGDVYIPFKFWKYLPAIGDTTKMTIALQDVGDGKSKANGFRWTAIHQHDGTYR